MAKQAERPRDQELHRLFDVLAPDDVRVKGSRIGIEHVLLLYRDGYHPLQLATHYPSLSLAEIEATVAYYDRNRAWLDPYLDAADRRADERWRQQAENPPEWLVRFLERAATEKSRVMPPDNTGE